jgi:hypothetical protein
MSFATTKSSGVHLSRLAPTPSEPCMEERNRYSTEVVRLLTQLGVSVTQAIMTPGV